MASLDLLFAALVVLCCFNSATLGYSRGASPKLSSSRLQVLSQSGETEQPSSSSALYRRRLIDGTKKISSIMGACLLAYQIPAVSRADSLEDVNNKLGDYGLPPILYVPEGFSPVVSEFGRGNIHEKMVNPIVVQFVYPSGWTVKKTSVDVNGEAGTISANDFNRGDYASLFVLPVDKGDALRADNVPLVTKFIRKAVSQKGDPTEGLNIYRIREGPVGTNGERYVLADFDYMLNTESGFLISRRAVASITSVGEGYLQGLFAVTTEKRWGRAGGRGGMEDSLRTIVESFRVYKPNAGLFSSSFPSQS